MTCKHEKDGESTYVARSDGIKEACNLCGAARMIKPEICNHKWVKDPKGPKERCIKCNTARIALDVHDVENNHKATSPI